jgi:hypothetical protein
MRRLILAAAACAALGACAKAPAPKSEFDYGVPLNDVMRSVMDQAAWGFWDRQGETTGSKGETISRVPPDPAKLTDENAKAEAEKEWDKARYAVVTLIQATNLIKLPGYQRTVEKNDNGDWIKYTDQLNALAHQALDAVDAKDGDKMFKVGGDIFEACGACHQKYLLPFIDPKTGSIPPGISVSGKPLHK